MGSLRLILLGAVVALGLLGAALADDAGISPLLFVPVIGLVIFLVYRSLESSPRKEESLPLKPWAGTTASPDSGDRISIAALADPALIVSSGWRVLAANDGALELFGGRIVGGDLRQTVRHPVVVEAVRSGLAGEAPLVRDVTTLGSQDGAFRVRVVRLDGERLLLNFTDVTQARLTERMRVDFVANASHELRTPLANISGFIETLLGPAAEDEPARRRFLDIMSREAGRMSRLIDDLLSLSRIELDKYVRPQTMLELPPLLVDVSKTLAMRLESDGRKLLMSVEPDLPQVVADRDQILQVLHNLISNALKYGHSGSPISVTAARDHSARGEEMVRVAVTDQGDGIAPEHLPRLTERFYRVDTGRSRSMGGTGLGLAIVKHIVERHRGRLEISSRQGEGTTVAFLLPVTMPGRAGEGDAAGEAGAASQNRNMTVT
ncbi:ATPase [Sandaracinobacter neustonicus]|uniref:histidine kinase n=1 Tax=Sandaracinobacter neustonicus TaxID=1715348 RepID=A0A501XPZ1_9SPHN|nr:ATP-binding protein [Sandaracinobacter neustonicus]TPE62177.1 ATPase [Sandaracinobacter neustonicus]